MSDSWFVQCLNVVCVLRQQKINLSMNNLFLFVKLFQSVSLQNTRYIFAKTIPSVLFASSVVEENTRYTY
jgi:hypothetical protein